VFFQRIAHNRLIINIQRAFRGGDLIQFKNPPPLVVVMFFGAMPKIDNFAG